jgi:RNA polymerase sigma factor (sigma-70 family)
MNDQTIIALIRSGKNDKALKSLYKHFPMISNLVLSKGGSKADAEDIFQEALIIVCKKTKEPGFTLTAQLSTYLYGICRFLWKDECKKRKYAVTDNIDNELSADIAESLREALYQEEKVLAQLGHRCRELLLLFYQGQLQLKAIAKKMGYSSEGAARNQKYKCLEGARNKLKELKQTTSTF